MSKHLIPTQALGDEDLPDLIIRMPVRQAQLYPETADTLSLDLLQQQMSHFKATQEALTYSAIDEVPATTHHTAPASFINKPRHGHGLNLGYNTTTQQKDSAAWADHESSACASCSKWSLACIHAAALNAFDEHDSDSDVDRRPTARVVQQLICLQKRYGDSEDASPHSHQHQKYEKLGPPMLQRWFHQSPRQEGFSGVATAQTLSVRAVKSRL